MSVPGTLRLELVRDALEPKGRRDRRCSTECAALGCGAGTSGGKRFCFDHVLLHPYASVVQRVLVLRGEIGPRDVEGERRKRVRGRPPRQAKVVDRG